MDVDVDDDDVISSLSELTTCRCPVMFRTHSPVLARQILITVSHEPLASSSWLTRTKLTTQPVWPTSVRKHSPVPTRHTLTLRSLDALASTSALTDSPAAHR